MEGSLRCYRVTDDALRTAMALEGDTLPSDSPAIRALAANSNNMAAALEEKSQRSAEETGFMVEAAAAALRYWQRGGTWFETQRAEFRLASSHFHAGNSGAAVSSAMRCIELCRQHDAPPFEQFFGYAMLGLAQRAAGDQAAFASSREAARVAYERIEAAEQHWCGTLLAQLDAPLPADEPSR